MSCPNCEKLQTELLSTQAAIEKHNKITPDIGCNIEVDLSALREHDAALVKPLEDLIFEIAEESAIEFKDERMRYHVIQMTISTWDKLQAKYAQVKDKKI